MLSAAQFQSYAAVIFRFFAELLFRRLFIYLQIFLYRRPPREIGLHIVTAEALKCLFVVTVKVNASLDGTEHFVSVVIHEGEASSRLIHGIIWRYRVLQPSRFSYYGDSAVAHCHHLRKSAGLTF